MVTTQQHHYLIDVWRPGDWQRARDTHPHFSHRDYTDGVLYLGVPSFTSSPDLIYRQLNRAKHARVLILDLRDNHGGWLETVEAFLGFFEQQRELLAKRVSRSQSEDVMIAPRHSGFRGSIVILVDSETASGAELAARHLQISHKAILLGDVTGGRVNEGHISYEKIGAGFVMPFAVVVTTAKLVMPGGEDLEGHGVTPDIKCIPTAEDLARGIDPCLAKALVVARKSPPQ